VVSFENFSQHVPPHISYKFENYYRDRLAKAADKIALESQRELILGKKLTDYQQALLDLGLKPNNSSIRAIRCWAWDREGNYGKSVVAKAIAALTPSILVVNISNLTNMCDNIRNQRDILLPVAPKNIIFDLPRSAIENKQYISDFFTVVENCLDGVLSCPKYHSQQITLAAEVIIFSNYSYDDLKAALGGSCPLSDDRVPSSAVIDLTQFEKPNFRAVVDERVTDMFSHCCRKVYIFIFSFTFCYALPGYS